jgi:erythromycin esterase
MNRRLLPAIVLIALAAGVFAQSDRTEWIVWTRSHHFLIASVVSRPDDDYADLQFLKPVLGDRRLVQLGESGHGVAEFDSVKVRLIKFLHEQMGFDVIAFESSIYECFTANAASTATGMLSGSIFGVWATEEVLPLFDYIKDSQQTERSLTLAGFDTQISSGRGVLSRPAFFRRIVAAVDASYAEEVAAFDADFVGRAIRFDNSTSPRDQQFYERLEGVLRANRESLAAAFPGEAAPMIAERTAWSMIAYIRQLRATAERPNDSSPEGGVGIRDAGMADNLTSLARDLYPDRKILIWAHNFHIRHANASTPSTVRTMGSWIAERFRPELYTIGLYMNRGNAAQNDRAIYLINPAPQGSMEWVLAGTGPSALFVDFLHQTQESGNAWMFQPVVTREWGVNSLTLTPREQYDGVLLIDRVSAPNYVRL